MGPLQYLAIGFEGNRFTREIMPRIEEIRGRNVIRILDLVFISRDDAGVVTTSEISDLPESEAVKLAAVEEATAGSWFSDDDIARIGDEIPDDSSVALILMEHLWAKPIGEAVERAHGSLLFEGFVPRETVNEVELLLGERA